MNNDEYDRKIIQLGFIRLEDYINSMTKILHKCKSCEKEYKIKPKEIKGKKCKCLDRSYAYSKKIKEKNIVLLSKYTNAKKKSLHKCMSCNFEFITTPKTVVQSKYGCPSCSGKRFSHDSYVKMLPDNIITKETYQSSAKYLKHECKICGIEWNTKPNYILHMGCGCPNCSSSKGEAKITKLLEELKINFSKEKVIRIKNKNLRFDFYLIDLDIFIEYDGIQHYFERDYFGGKDYFKKLQKYDKEKNEWCKANEKKLLRISYKQIDKLTKNYIMEII